MKRFGFKRIGRMAADVKQGYSGERPDVMRMFQQKPRRVLDVGCGAGWLGAEIKRKWGHVEVAGIEADLELAAMAAGNIEHVIVGRCDEEQVLNEAEQHGPFDYIVCADLLEHLMNPWAFLQSLSRLLAPEGLLITSIPNVRHVSTFVSLGLFGTWPRRNRGIHDADHHCFFARRDILALLTSAGFEPLLERRNLRLLESQAWTLFPAKLIDFWPLRPFFTFQYLHCSKYVGCNGGQAGRC